MIYMAYILFKRVRTDHIRLKARINVVCMYRPVCRTPCSITHAAKTTCTSRQLSVYRQGIGLHGKSHGKAYFQKRVRPTTFSPPPPPPTKERMAVIFCSRNLAMCKSRQNHVGGGGGLAHDVGKAGPLFCV